MHILICVWDDDGPIETPDLIGWVWLQCKPGEFQIPINARNRKYGTVKGCLKLEYQEDGKRKQHKQRENECTCAIM